uniref:C2 NT-type domain-containing protein n=1 Tax=Lotharella globosa TaxID=91324 RepID=A0A7S3YRB0_9EUKA
MKLFKNIALLGKKKCHFEYTITIHSVENLSDARTPVYCRCIRGNRKHDTKVSMCSGNKVRWNDERFSFTGTLYELKSGKGRTSYSKKKVWFKIRGGAADMALIASLDLAKYTSKSKELHPVTLSLKDKRKKKTQTLLKISIQCQEASNVVVISAEHSDSDGSDAQSLMASDMDTPRHAKINDREQTPRTPRTPRTPEKLAKRAISPQPVNERTGHLKPEAIDQKWSHKKTATVPNEELDAKKAQTDMVVVEGEEVKEDEIERTNPAAVQQDHLAPENEECLRIPSFHRDINNCDKLRTSSSFLAALSLNSEEVSPTMHSKDNIALEHTDFNNLFSSSRREGHKDGVVDTLDTIIQDMNTPKARALPTEGFVRTSSAPRLPTHRGALTGSPKTLADPKTAPAGKRNGAEQKFVWDDDRIQKMDSKAKKNRQDSVESFLQDEDKQLRAFSSSNRMNIPMRIEEDAEPAPSTDIQPDDQQTKSEPEIRKRNDALEYKVAKPPRSRSAEGEDSTLKRAKENVDMHEKRSKVQCLCSGVITPCLHPVNDRKANRVGHRKVKSKSDSIRWYWNTIPVMPFAVVKTLLNIKAFKSNQQWAMDLILETFDKALEINSSDLTQLIGGLSNVTMLMHLLTSYGNQAEKEVKTFTTNNVHRLRAIGNRSFGEVAQHFVRMMPKLDCEMLFPGDSGLECPVVNVYLSKYEAMLGMLEAQHVSPSLQCQVLQRLFRAFTTHVVNGLLDAHNKHLCDAIGGMGQSQSQWTRCKIMVVVCLDLQVVLSTIDGWCQEHAPKSAFFEKAKKELCPLKDISNILLRGRAIRAVPVLGLNYAQLERFANFYNNNVKPEVNDS